MFSSRAFLLDWERFRRRNLPMPLPRLDLIRAILRWARGRTTVLGFEDAFLRQIEAGRIRHEVLSQDLGASMHVLFAQYADAPGFATVVARWEAGEIPPAQIASGFEWNFCHDAWL